MYLVIGLFPLDGAPLEAGRIMSVSVSAVQLRILVVAISVVTVGQLVVASIGDGRAASLASIAKPLTGEFTAAREQSVQSPTRLYAGPSLASSCSPFQSAGARPAVGEVCKGAPLSLHLF
jgi:hypothetical protein